jgi:hypothetical protein
MKKVICFSGWKRSGKDEMANYLVRKYGATRVAFADPLKDMVAQEYDIPREYLDLNEFKETPLLKYPVNPQDKFSKTIVDLLTKEFKTANGKQVLGFDPEGNALAEGDRGELIATQAYYTPRSLAILKGSTNRAVASNFWVQKALDKIKQSSSEMIVLTDLRYRSETLQILEAFGDNATIIRVNRFETSPSLDPSERDLDDYLFKNVISNKGTLEEAFEQLEKILKN